MGKVILKRGDLFTTTMPIIAHGVNCSNGFASGVAAQIAKLYPEVKQAYHAKYADEGWDLGDIQVVEVRSGPPALEAVVNVASQQFYGRDPNVVYVDYHGLELGLARTLIYAADLGHGVALPRIGCGLANGDWWRVLSIIRDEVARRSVDVEVWTM